MVQTANKIIALLLWVAGITMLCVKASPVIGALFFVPFALGPHAVTHVAVFHLNNLKSQIILMAAMLLYFAWFTFVYVSIFYIYVDPQGPIALVFVGIYSLPVLIALWLTAIWIDRKPSRKRVQGSDTSEPPVTRQDNP